MVSKGQHPYSKFMVKDGYTLYNMSGHDILIDIAGMYFPLRSLSHDKSFNQSSEYGTGTRDPTAITEHEHGYLGSFTYASFLVDDVSPSLTTAGILALTKALEDASDEGKSRYFNIFLLEVPGNRTPDGETDMWTDDPETSLLPGTAGTGLCAGATFIEALVDCKLTKASRQYNVKDTVVTQRDFVYSRRIPR